MTLERTYRDYENDPQFRQLVDLMLYHLVNLHATPSELRAAVMCAAIKLENGRVTPPMMRLNQETGEVTIMREDSP